MALGALAMARALAGRVIELQCAAIGRSERRDRRIHLRKQGGLLRTGRIKRAQGPAMGQKCAQRRVSLSVHDSGLTATPLSHRVRSASHPSK